MRVLVIEDDRQLAGAVRQGLEDEGFQTDVASNGLEGLSRGRGEQFDAIILDILLPGLNGFLVCKQLREAGVWTPILMLTAKDGELDEAEALDSGADDFLSKPFYFVVLVARLKALIRRSLQQHPDIVTAGDLEVNSSSHRVERAGTTIELTPREFEVLELLMRRAGEPVSKTEILEEVWDFAYDGPPNIVEVYIRHLRRKIDEPFKRNAIQTVRLVGYRLDPDGG